MLGQADANRLETDGKQNFIFKAISEIRPSFPAFPCKSLKSKIYASGVRKFIRGGSRMSGLPRSPHALVTGGGRGIGREIAAELTRAGATVTVLGRLRATLDEAVA